MGIQRVVRLGDETPLEWEAIENALRRVGESPQLRMIDQELCLPGELPQATWQELRVALQGGMVTLRREANGLACVIWSNSDEALIRSWRRAIWAVLMATGSGVEEEGALYNAEDFASKHKLLPD